VRLEKGSWLEKLYGKPALRVNTVHHQGIRDLAPTMRAAAFAPDGVIEAIEDRDGRWVRAVQWHPEWARLHSQGLDDMEAAFRDFVAAAADKGKGPRRS
jgi:putative glutamine amidotransferase